MNKLESSQMVDRDVELAEEVLPSNVKEALLSSPTTTSEAKYRRGEE